MLQTLPGIFSLPRAPFLSTPLFSLSASVFTILSPTIPAGLIFSLSLNLRLSLFELSVALPPSVPAPVRPLAPHPSVALSVLNGHVN